MVELVKSAVYPALQFVLSEARQGTTSSYISNKTSADAGMNVAAVL